MELISTENSLRIVDFIEKKVNERIIVALRTNRFDKSNNEHIVIEGNHIH
jgi:hypothetical protein